ncbi:hypothetical protein N2152v2_004924 [Parachlorella kessleri]
MPDAQRILHNTPLAPQQQPQHSQMPDAERIVYGTPLGSVLQQQQQQQQQEEEAFAEDAYQEGRVEEEYAEEICSRTEGDPEVDEQRLHLLEASLQHVAQLGWSAAALAAGAADVGLSPSSAGLLARGEAELVEYFNARCNHDLEERLRAMESELGSMKTTEKVRTGVKLRLEMNAPYINSWAQALSLQARPDSAARALQQRMDIADIIWHAAGDKSTDFNWYTKRTLLLGVYSATELYMLTDSSPGFADTWAALDRRLADVLQLGRAVRGVASLAEEAGSLLAQLAGGLNPQRGGGGRSSGPSI